jgi:hypothetical protein
MTPTRLLAKGAKYIKSGAGQYFTQSALIDGLVDLASATLMRLPS